MALTTLDEKTALVALDLINAVAAIPTQPYTAAEVITRTAELAAEFRTHGAPVVLVRVDANPGAPGRTEAATGSRSRAMPEGAGLIVDALAGHPEDIVVLKRNWGAFHGTDLDLHLRRRGITQVVLTGIATSIAVESTARAAHEHGYNVTLATDAMSDLDSAAHQHSVERVFPRLGESGTTAEILELFAKTR
ncbi:nicotinamidase-related amidase [Kibdelosporangium banguiense]|uniref:Nicotinamidase-related amidase n=1 Tax=Kibdelosporangium banguiense TaxID=1365924 RepID=A0ABS4U274_9PSEU|nr:isochorismatase family protein [Kibdelosporangium banguiense]MBP2330721.1 nicotinamidase-related amidase [Kibdelosporangium banguiense]